MSLLPMADASRTKKIKEQATKLVHKRNLVGAANNTKWNELISEIRDWEQWQPSYRTKWVNGYISEWDVEWYYHLPFPFVGVQWFDIGIHQVITNGKFVEDQIIDHSKIISDLLTKIGLSFDAASDFIRVWGYLPKCYEEFDD